MIQQSEGIAKNIAKNIAVMGIREEEIALSKASAKPDWTQGLIGLAMILITLLALIVSNRKTQHKRRNVYG